MRPERLLTARAARADLFGVTLKTLHHWEARQVLVPVRVRGRRYFSVADVEALMTRGRLGDPGRELPGDMIASLRENGRHSIW